MSAAAARALRSNWMQFFALFEIAAKFDINANALAAKFRTLQIESHPDKFASAADSVRRAAQQRSALINDAYKTLRDPVARAAYLIKNTCGADPFDERNTKMPLHFLHAQIELREEIAENCAAGNLQNLAGIAAKLEADQALLRAKITQTIDVNQDCAAAIDDLRQLRFLQKVASEIDDAVERLES